MLTAPCRLSQSTRDLAHLALSGAWGDTLVDPPLTIDGRDDLATLSDEMRYAQCVRLIAEQAPLRIFPGLRLVGSASLKPAPLHVLPVYANGKPAFGSTSHLTLGFDQVLQVGYRGLRAQVEERLSRGDLDAQGMDLLNAMLVCLDAATTWHRRYLEQLDALTNETGGEECALYLRIRDNLCDVPENPPTTFY